VPQKVARYSQEALDLCPALVKKANKNLASDISCAAILLAASFSSAYVNILVNLKFLRNKDRKKKILKYFKKQLKLVKAKKERVEKDVCKIIGR